MTTRHGESVGTENVADTSRSFFQFHPVIVAETADPESVLKAPWIRALGPGSLRAAPE
jgi:hypothetical protein